MLREARPYWMTGDQMRGYDDAKRVCGYALRYGRISDAHLHGRVLDFGCGPGGSSIFLAQQSKDVTAIDLRLDVTRNLAAHPGHPRRVLTDDGFALMRKEIGYNLITAFYLGTVNTRREFAEEFRDAARHALASDGRIIITSDLETLATVCAVFDLPPKSVKFPKQGDVRRHVPGCIVTGPPTL